MREEGDVFTGGGAISAEVAIRRSSKDVARPHTNLVVIVERQLKTLLLKMITSKLDRTTSGQFRLDGQGQVQMAKILFFTNNTNCK